MPRPRRSPVRSGGGADVRDGLRGGGADRPPGVGLHALPVSYGRLREACQTDVDGTSIDTLEEGLLCSSGLEAEQVMVPVDHLLLPEAAALPAIVVVRRPNGLTHFVVAWLGASDEPWLGDGPRHGAALADLPPFPRRPLRTYAATPYSGLACLGRERRVPVEPCVDAGRRWGLGAAEVEQAPGGRPWRTRRGFPWRPWMPPHACSRPLSTPVGCAVARKRHGCGHVPCPCRPGGPGRALHGPGGYWMVHPAPPVRR